MLEICEPEDSERDPLESNDIQVNSLSTNGIIIPIKTKKIFDEGKKAFKCELCNKEFSQKVHRNSHISRVHERIKPFKCDTCALSYASKKELKHHAETVHEGKEPYNCNLCSANFTLIGRV